MTTIKCGATQNLMSRKNAFSERIELLPQVILSAANISHYNYTALALHNAGYLKRYFSSYVAHRGNPKLARCLPSSWQKKLNGRQMPGIPANKIITLPWTELAFKVLLKTNGVSRDRAIRLFAQSYDQAVKRRLEKCDVFHFVSSGGLQSAQAAKSNGSVIICDVRIEYPDYQRQILSEEYTRLRLPYSHPGSHYMDVKKSEYAIADHLILPSSYAKQTFIQAGFEPSRIFVLPYGIDLGRFQMWTRSSKNISRRVGAFRIIFVGQVIPRKGLHYLVEAFERLALPDAELVILGGIDPSMKPWLANAVQKNDKITVVGSVPKLELVHYYNQGSVFVLPSLADSWGLVTLEAMACGLPVIVTENTGSKEATQDGIEGFIVPIRDPEAIAAKLLILYKDRDLCEAMGLAAHKRVKEFTWEKYGERLLNLYQNHFLNYG